MRAAILIDVPDDWLANRIEEHWAEYARNPEDAEFFGEKPEPRVFLVERLEAVAEDELRIALWGWPISTSVEIQEV